MYADSLPNDNEPISAPDPVTRGQKTADTPENFTKCRVTVDNLSLTYHPSSVSDGNRLLSKVIEEVSDVLGAHPDDWIELDHGFYSYQRRLIGPANSRLYFDPKNGLDFHLSLSGQACQRAGSERLCDFFPSFVNAGAKARRIDLALDDYEKRITPAQFLDELEGPNRVSHAKEIVKMEGQTLGSSGRGETVYLGDPQSSRRLRVYDKEFESGGKIDAIRWELQERDRAAVKAAYDLANEDLNDVVRNRLVGFVDFRLRESAEEVEDRLRWEPYEQLMVGATRAQAYFPVEEKSIEEKEEWFRRQMGPTLAMLIEYRGGDLEAISDYANDGRKRLKPRHIALIASANKKQ